MTIALSSSICPQWDLRTIILQAKQLGYDAIQLRGLEGHAHLPSCPALADASAVRAALTEAGIRLTGMATDCSLDSSDRHRLCDNKERLLETLDVASQLGASYVTLRAGSVRVFHNRDKVLSRIVRALRELAPRAAELGVALLVENAGNLGSSRDVWYIVDAAGHPAVGCLWNPCRAVARGDTHGVAVPRIGRKTVAVSLMDAVFTAAGAVAQYATLGQGNAGLSRFLTLMAGLGHTANLVVDWPSDASAPASAEVLAANLAWIQAELTRIAQAPDLSAYKGDKNAPRFAAKAPRATVHG